MSNGTPSGAMTPAKFIAKWSPVTLPERAASQEHFIDLCRLLGQPTPAEHDATGAEYAFEKGVAVTGGASKGAAGDRGFADVWWRSKFAWEYKRKDKCRDLTDAYRQLCQYRDDLENPPLLIVSDISRTIIRTNFTGTVQQVHTVNLAEIDQPDKLDLLRRVFTDPMSFRPEQTPAKITEEIAEEVAKLAQSIQSRRNDPQTTAHFLMKCMFCLFAEDVDLLPSKLFSRVLQQWHYKENELTARLTDLFAQMRTGGAFGAEPIAWFNGGLFDEAPAIELRPGEVQRLRDAANRNWSQVEPSIFGTLFERSLDPAKRAQIGAHYTASKDIMDVVEPVVMAPLRREWAQVKAKCEELAEKKAQAERRRRAGSHAEGDLKPATYARRIEKLIIGFQRRLASVRILDPACGSGNFLYVVLQQLLNLEKEVITFSSQPRIGLSLLPQVRPTQLHGIEINPYAAELAQVVIWIGYLQWMRDNGFVAPSDPILAKLQTIENRDAILEFSPSPCNQGEGRGEGSPRGEAALGVRRIPPLSPGDAEPGGAEEKRGNTSHSKADQPAADPRKTPRPATWPKADFIIGNPPFLGSKVFRQNGLPDDYVSAMYAAYDLPKTSDLCCYWFELARRAILSPSPFNQGEGRGEGSSPSPSQGEGRGEGKTRSVRVGLLATQGIRGGDNRTVLERIKETGDIFMAWSDRDWILDGAAVHVSMVGFDDGTQKERALDGQSAQQINTDLTAGVDATRAEVLAENTRLSFMGDTKQGAFDITWDDARRVLAAPTPNARSNHEVVRPWVNGLDVTRRPRSMWIVDFPEGMSEQEAAGFETPFELVRKRVKPWREENRKSWFRDEWWIHYAPRPDMRSKIEPLPRFIATARVSKFRLFVWLSGRTLPDCQLITFARSDDYFFGVLHSSIHELWARRMGTQLREVESGFRYTPTTCFETFPLPWPPGKEPSLNNVAQPPSAVLPAGGREVGCSAADAQPGAAVPHNQLVEAIAAAARELNEQRERWLNPPEWIGPIAASVDAQDDFADVPDSPSPSQGEGRGEGASPRELIRQSAIMARAAQHAQLKKRTLTNLYNERPTWLRLAHKKLDRAVLAAYAAIDPAGGWSPAWADVWEDTGPGQPLAQNHELIARRAEIDQKLLASLLRLNGTRSGDS